jgi:hypothetical protein
MEDRPQDPEVREAYDNLIKQTRAQYDALVDAGYEFTFFDEETDPYNGNPLNAIRDLRANKRMAVLAHTQAMGLKACQLLRRLEIHCCKTLVCAGQINVA